MGDCIRYSEAFKLQVVREIEEKKHPSCCAAAEAYGIGGSMTVSRWVREYGKSHLLGRVVHVQSPGERSELRKAKDRIAELEKALVDAHLDLRLDEPTWRSPARRGGRAAWMSSKKKEVGCRPLHDRNRRRADLGDGGSRLPAGRDEPAELLCCAP